VYRMLIVDDEEIITDGLFEVFRKLNLDLDLYKAYSGYEALELLNRTRVDIVLSDIRMPGMGGLELMENIRRKWSHCKIIFLTGHHDFDYVYRAIQTPGVNYLLKSEGYEKIITAVSDAIEELENSLRLNNLIQQSRESLTTLETLAQGNYFRYLLQGARAADVMVEDFHKLNIPLDPSLPVLMVLGGLAPSFSNSLADRQEAALAVKILAETFLTEKTTSLGMIDRYGDLVWFIQSRPNNGLAIADDYARTVRFLEGEFELIQRACKESLQVSVAVTIGAEPCEWKWLSTAYDSIRRWQHLRAGDGAQMVQLAAMKASESSELARERASREKAEALAAHLEGGRRDEFLRIFDEVTTPLLDGRNTGSNFLKELYFMIALILLSYMNRWELHDKVGAVGLIQIDEHASWYESFEFLKRTAESLFAVRRTGERNRAAEVVEKVRLYIEQHLAEDLSLVRLASEVHFNPSYLSRLFKQECGRNLSDYIEEARIGKARELLKQDELKISEVGVRVGYDAAHSFTRFFKKMTGLTPLEQREALRAKK
jgi:two-component system response regulator YesN